MTFFCGSMTAPGLADAGKGACCVGAAVYGKDRYTCWTPVYDLEQQPLQPGRMGIRVKMCADCAYRPGSPERRGEDGYQGDAEFLDQLVMTGEFFACHQGFRRPAAWRHPSGAEIPGHPAGYDPPIRDGKPYKADGTPADLCAGWGRAAAEVHVPGGGGIVTPQPYAEECTRIYAPCGAVAHLSATHRSALAPMCPAQPAWPGEWLGTGSQDEYDYAASLPLCAGCEDAASVQPLAARITDGGQP